MRAASLFLGLLGWMAGCAARHAADDVDIDPGPAANGASRGETSGLAAEQSPQAHIVDPSTVPAAPDEPAPQPRAGRDAAVDAIVPIDARPDAPPATTDGVTDEELACNQASSALSDFLQKYNQCSTDADCVTLGSCGPYSFVGAPKNVSSTASSLHSAMLSKCGRRLGYDGQLQEAYCSGDRCSVRLIQRYCGQAIIPPPQQPSCDVTLRLEVTRGDRNDGFNNFVPWTNLSLQANNNTNSTKRVVLPAPCTGAYVFEGLNGYTPTLEPDCFATCPRDATKTVDVPTNATVELVSHSLTPLSFLCGQDLPKGEYDVTLRPLTITGATTCGTTTVHVSMP